MRGFPARIALKTPAKINLLLHIQGKRSDGYHDIITIMQMVELWDEIIIEKSEKLELICSHPDMPSGQGNLIYRAAVRLKEFSGTEGGARIRLEKSIPVAAGLGGGSSDAAATLVGLNTLWGLDYANDKLMAIGRELGSDVPFFL
ncbi:MAG: 4-(cytidine 5'-diphospho)-2-C-methyl-D-erythritol kinase, partial [Nitrospirota bacterium]|nr:4-(cytidine 5'-diphospho)-2-C-methyl-D-erythritol kinase [Nitrospirota bacterium]